jgi:hypothetical protein
VTGVQTCALPIFEHSDHGPAFHELVGRYPLTERAKGYLMALDAGAAAKA